MTLSKLEDAAKAHHLAVLGVCHTVPDDTLGDGSIVLLGPQEPGFWPHVTAQPEFQDNAPDPLDRWSARVIGNVAGACGGEALLPFGKPARPFIGWALRSGRAWSSPVGLLVHDQAGLMVSYRGAVLIGERLALPEPAPTPCNTCEDKPCLSACPIDALTGDGYRIPECKSFLEKPAGKQCVTKGCEVRRACPISQTYGRQNAQSAHHMLYFRSG